MRLEAQRVLVTGGSGFVGRALRRGAAIAIVDGQNAEPTDIEGIKKELLEKQDDANSDLIRRLANTKTPDSLAALIEVLLRSMNPPVRTEIDRLWAEEAERRVQEIEDGTVTPLDGGAVLREVRQRLRR